MDFSVFFIERPQLRLTFICLFKLRILLLHIAIDMMHTEEHHRKIISFDFILPEQVGGKCFKLIMATIKESFLFKKEVYNEQTHVKAITLIIYLC